MSAGERRRGTRSGCRAHAPFRAAFAAAFLATLAGCALAGNPQPPTLWLPVPVKDLTAARAGNDVRLHWTMPRQTTDKVTLKGPQRAHFCWSWIPAAGTKAPAPSCKAAGDGTFPPEKPADISLPLPAELTSGAPRAVAFVVELQNPSGKTAGPSNPALVASGAPPPAVTGLSAEAQADGVVLHWDKAPSQPGLILRFNRALVKKPGTPPPSEGMGAAPAEQQTLEVSLDPVDPGVALDRDAALDHTWRYTAERVLHVEAGQHSLEIAGAASPAVTLDAKDVFPPAVPRGLAAVADAQAQAIDLSWLPDSEADLAGYRIYRRDVTAGGAAEPISGTKPIVPSSFTDKAVVAGHRYAYAVSAIDHDGNESARSEEVEEELPQ